MIYPIISVDDNKTLYFNASTAYDAMKKLLYYLSLSNKSAENAQINKTETNRFLYVIVGGKTYSTKM